MAKKLFYNLWFNITKGKFTSIANIARENHSACSEGYNFNIYKDKINYSVNSQSREQMHAKLDKCCLSLKLKTYHDFFAWMTAYFAINNLRNMNLL